MITSAEKLAALRCLLQQEGGWGFVIPRQNRYQGEYVNPCDERLKWLTDFSGSAGYAIVTLNQACLFVDGRYTLQANQQVNLSLFQVQPSTDTFMAAWLEGQVELIETPSNLRLFYDPWLHTSVQIEKWKKLTKTLAIEFIPCSQNFIDRLWTDQPQRPVHPIYSHPLSYAGVSSNLKQEALRQKLRQEKAQVLLLTSPESICWLFNIRGQDLEFLPSIDMMALIYENGQSQWFIDPIKVPAAIRTEMGSTVEILPFEQLTSTFEALTSHTVWMDPHQTPVALYILIPKENRLLKEDPCILPRALKNEIEQSGARLAQVKDGIALVRFLAWLDNCSVAEKTTLTEYDLAIHLLQFRQENEGFKGVSFPTIVGSGEHGAIIHYTPSLETAKTLELHTLLLIDSGGQYNEGTTDTTRTIIIGEPSAEHKCRFTQVLKGHITLARAIFPQGTTGHQLDVLARFPLWQEGLDYEHGTGHGVGSFLNVHEGPQRISKVANGTALQPGMIMSNEPGYYKTGDYGIRLENLILVWWAEDDHLKAQKMMKFETLTLVPFDQKLIDKSLLNSDEVNWINVYHHHIYKKLAPLLQEKDKVALEWLKKATAAI